MPLSKAGSHNVKAVSDRTGIPESSFMSVLAEVIVPHLKDVEVLAAVRESHLKWMVLEDGQSCTVEIRPWEEAKFRARVSNFNKSGSKHLTLNRISNDIEKTVIEVTNDGNTMCEKGAGQGAVDARWMALKDGESVTVEVPGLREAAFRSRVSAAGRKIGARLSCQFHYPEKQGDRFMVTVTNLGSRDQKAQRQAKPRKESVPAQKGPGIDAFK